MILDAYEGTVDPSVAAKNLMAGPLKSNDSRDSKAKMVDDRIISEMQEPSLIAKKDRPCCSDSIR